MQRSVSCLGVGSNAMPVGGSGPRRQGLVSAAGSYLGARLQRHLPERSLRRLLGVIACLVAARYMQTSIQQPSRSRPAHATTR
jgi:hypothetical protein